MEVNFITDKPEVLVRLTYDHQDKPIVLAAGKKRERATDLEAINDWLRALLAQIKGSEAVP